MTQRGLYHLLRKEIDDKSFDCSNFKLLVLFGHKWNRCISVVLDKFIGLFPDLKASALCLD